MKIELGKNEHTFTDVVISGTDWQTGEDVVISDISENGIICKQEITTTDSIKANGLTLTVDVDELAYALMNITHDTNGRYNLTKLIKTIFVKYGEYVNEDDLFDSTSILVKECSKHISDDMKTEKHVLKATENILGSIKEW